MKKTLTVILLAVCIAAITVSTASLAYFTDTQTVENTFAVGDVTIKLDEAKIQLDADSHAQLVNPAARVEGSQDYGKLYPGFSIKKDPTITNTGSEKAYVGAKVTITTTNGITDTNRGIFDELLSGGLLADVENASITKTLNGDSYEICIVYKNVLGSGDAVILFDTLSVSSDYGKTEMAQLNGMKITVIAYAVQSVGMDNGALAALQAAFNEFDHITAP